MKKKPPDFHTYKTYVFTADSKDGCCWNEASIRVGEVHIIKNFLPPLPGAPKKQGVVPL